MNNELSIQKRLFSFFINPQSFNWQEIPLQSIFIFYWNIQIPISILYIYFSKEIVSNFIRFVENTEALAIYIPSFENAFASQMYFISVLIFILFLVYPLILIIPALFAKNKSKQIKFHLLTGIFTPLLIFHPIGIIFTGVLLLIRALLIPIETSLYQKILHYFLAITTILLFMM